MDNNAIFQKLALWEQITKQAAELAAQEKTLRQELFDHFFPAPKEGVNDFELNAGYLLKGTYKINRNIEEESLEHTFKRIEDEGHTIDRGAIVEYKPKLILGAYKKLPQDIRLLFDNTLTIKPGLPELKINPPPKKKASRKKKQ